MRALWLDAVACSLQLCSTGGCGITECLPQKGLAYHFWQCVSSGGVQQGVHPTIFILPIACLGHFSSGVDGVGGVVLATDPVALSEPDSDLGPLACPCLPSHVSYDNL
jgi:hypothetical protein